MAIKIQTQTPGIPIEIGKLNFNFDTSDESIQAFFDDANDVKKEMESINPVDGKEIEAAKSVLKKGFDYTLEEGAFDKIYEQTPSVLHLVGYYTDLTDSIAEELKKLGLTESQQQKAKKYLKNKKK